MPRIYVASLTDYNAGELHGDWIDAAQEPDEIMEEVQAMLAKSPTAKEEGREAEEWAIHDYYEFGTIELHEFDSFERVSKIAKMLDEFPSCVVAHFLTECSHYDLNEMLEKIEERYLGKYERHLTEECAVADHLWDAVAEDPEIPERYRSYLGEIARGMARDALLSGEVTTIYEGCGVWHLIDCDT
ncbi:antirestriction protein ArdA [Streptomyces noursei]|uniref:antirestriction protein ArdA n=1 Tax=Streptomyces noursei TaxID=1971 RepID=UPI00167C1C08|nr:antirestriction protein ArdA [Streptomyces noursei]MCZ1015635.1 antirestriction protein ArdA [Streptomyces noursei]GGW89626.1 antirestriction protein ArdA [Streptomyces noursei]